MGKYEPLGEFLRNQRATVVPMTFAEIERVIGSKLPNSQKYPAWWSNSTSNNVMTQVWLDAGFQTERVDVEKKRVVFRRASGASESVPPHDRHDSGGQGLRHPLIGWMEGTVTVPDGVDLTEPTDPEWGEAAYGNTSQVYERR
jgi:hypothetical protein